MDEQNAFHPAGAMTPRPPGRGARLRFSRRTTALFGSPGTQARTLPGHHRCGYPRGKGSDALTSKPLLDAPGAVAVVAGWGAGGGDMTLIINSSL